MSGPRHGRDGSTGRRAARRAEPPPDAADPPPGVPPAAPGPGAANGPDTADAGQRVRIRRRRWNPGQLPFRLDFAPGGVVLGVDSVGMSATFPLLVPTHSTRVGIVGEAGLARLVVLRLLGLSCDLTVVTGHRDAWQRLSVGVPETPFAISHQVRRWPLEGTPPPWALVIDMDDPPPAGFTRSPWSTVVHLAPRVPAASGWWQSAHLVLTTRAHAKEVAALRPRLDASAIERLSEDDVVAVDQSGVSVFRPSLSQREYGLLTAIDRMPGTP